MSLISGLAPFVAGAPYTSGDRLPIFEPATGRNIGEVLDVGAAGVDAAVEAARLAFPGWSELTPKDRAAVLFGIAEALEKHVDQFAELEARDVGKPLAAAAAEILSAADKYRYFAGTARSLTQRIDEYVAGDCVCTPHRRLVPGQDAPRACVESVRPHLARGRLRIDAAVQHPSGEVRSSFPGPRRLGHSTLHLQFGNHRDVLGQHEGKYDETRQTTRNTRRHTPSRDDAASH